MYTHIQNTLTRYPLIRQLLGGVAGAFVALMLYGAYDAASNVFRAMVSTEAPVITDEMRVENMAAVAARARAIVEEVH